MRSQDDLQRYEELAKKWLSNTITPAEKEEFSAWYNASQGAPLDIPSSFAESDEAHRQRILYNINKAIKIDGGKKNKVAHMRWLSIAAACILILGIPCAYFHIRNEKAKQSALTFQKKQIKNDVAPGGNKAMLTLSDGSSVVLNDAKKGVITKQGKALINKSDDNKLVYEATAPMNADQHVVYNTITTPKGGQFQVVLSDGSKVWLNAASSITFPTAFTKNERRVNITGEVYFEVAKNKNLPFRVVSGKQTVEVMGTHFNINAYADESAIRTTLAEGSVKVLAHNRTVFLKPDQQAKVSNAASGEIDVKAVDVDDILAWKNGNFVFENAEIPFIMRQAARWYDVNVKYEGNVSERRFSGSISRSVNLSELLKMLKYSGVNFRIADQTIIVGP